MLWDFTYSLKQALILFPILAIIVALPFLVYQYSKYGSVHGWRSITLYSFIFYLVVAYFLVILPLPSREYVSQMTSPYTQFKPFFFLETFRNHGLITGGFNAWVEFIQTITFQQVFFNVLLFVPFGVYMKYYFKHGFIVTILLSFALSLFFEFTQLSGLYGIYPRPYRIFDVDDLLLNTIGGIVGYIITPLIVFLFPTRDEMDDESYSKAYNVGMGRRVVAILIDGLMMLGIATLVLVLLKPDLSLMKFVLNPIWTVKKVLGHVDLLLLCLLLACTFMVFQVWVLNGKTLGKMLVHLRLDDHNHKHIRFGKLLIRYGVIFMEIALFLVSLSLVFASKTLSIQAVDGPLIGLFISFIVFTGVLLDVLMSVFSGTLMLHERLSGIRNLAY